MRESRTSGSVRGAWGNSRPYRDPPGSRTKKHQRGGRSSLVKQEVVVTTHPKQRGSEFVLYGDLTFLIAGPPRRGESAFNCREVAQRSIVGQIAT
jgi:hypothetical protein